MSGAFRLGFVEGFYGKPWTWEARAEAADFLAANGFGFYLYAPKGDSYLRRRWHEPWPSAEFAELRLLIGQFRARGICFGVGLSPYGFHREDPDAAEKQLLRKAEEIAALGVDHLALLFDDMKGDLPELAARQSGMLHAVKARFPELAYSLCPTYYSNDPVLDRLFGPRPPGYLCELGERLDPEVELFWTGERICSPEYRPADLREIGRILRRKPLLWDNYPVNDTEAMCRFLHLRGFTGRPAGLGELLSGHLVNPMHQAVLSRIPALTLAESYRLGDAYEPEAAFQRAARRTVGGETARRLTRDRELFQREGREALGAEKRAALEAEYAADADPGAREVAAWLRGDFAVTRESLRDQL